MSNPTPPPPRPCQLCGTPFVSRIASRRFCSKACCHRAYQAALGPARLKSYHRRCRYCGDRLPPRHVVICTEPDCRRRHHNELSRARVARRGAGLTRTCRHCGAAYAHWGGNSKWPVTCSPACQRARKKKLDRELVKAPLSEETKESQRAKFRAKLADPVERAKWNRRCREYAARRREIALLRDVDAVAAAGGDVDRRDDA